VLRRMAEVGFVTREEAAAALRQPIKLKPMRPTGSKSAAISPSTCGACWKTGSAKNQVMSLGLRVYTTADAGLHRVAQKAIRDGMDTLVKRNGYRGPLKHLSPKERPGFQERQVKYFPEISPPQGHPGHRPGGPGGQEGPGRRASLPLRGARRGLGAAAPGPGNPGAPPGRLASFGPGDVVQVRLIKQDRQGKRGPPPWSPRPWCRRLFCPWKSTPARCGP
jgi:hypothetical protein